MKILINSPYFYPATDFGGPVTLSLDLAKELISQGHSITVSTTDIGNNKKRIKNREETYNDIAISRFPNLSNWIAQKLFLFFSLGYLSKRFKKLVKECDIIYTLNCRSINNFLLLKAAKKFNKKVVMSPFGGLVQKKERKNLNKLFDLFFGKKIIKKVSYFFAVNDFEKESFLIHGIDEKKIYIVPNSINPEKFVDYPKNAFRNKYNIPKNKRILLFFSRLYYAKKPQFVIEIFKNIMHQIPDTVLVMFGTDHGMYNKLLAMKKEYNIPEERLIIIPETAGDFKTAVYQDSDLLIVPSPGSEFPLVLLEAMYFNVPIITSDLSLHQYHNKAAKIITMNIEKYQTAIMDLMNNKELYKKYSKKAGEIIRANYTTKKIICQIVKYFKEILDSN